MTLDIGIFARHLDLTPLGVKRHGRVLCPFHRETTPSFSVDLDAGIFHCFGCGVQGGVKAFAVRVGEVAPGIDTRPAPEDTPWLAAMRLARRQPWNDEFVALTYTLADFVRTAPRVVAMLRAEAREDTEDTWNRLARAAQIETLAHRTAMELDG